VRCSPFRCVTVCCSVEVMALDDDSERNTDNSVLQYVAVRCIALQCVAVHYSVLQCGSHSLIALANSV